MGSNPAQGAQVTGVLGPWPGENGRMHCFLQLAFWLRISPITERINARSNISMLNLAALNWATLAHHLLIGGIAGVHALE